MKIKIWSTFMAALFVAAAPAWAAPERNEEKRAAKEDLRVTTQRVTRLAVFEGGEKLSRAEKKRVTLGAHVQHAIRARARREGITVSKSEVTAQLKEWNIPAAAADPDKARNYDEIEQAMALRDVAEARLLFIKMAAQMGDPKKAYEAIVTEHIDDLPNAKFEIKDVLKYVPSLLSAGTGGGGKSETETFSALGQALGPKPAPMAKALEESVKEFNGDPDALPLVYPNSVVTPGGSRDRDR